MTPWLIPEFVTGLALGLVATFIVLAVRSPTNRWRRDDALPLAGIAFAVAGLASITIDNYLPLPVVIGVTGLGVMGGRGGTRHDVPTACAHALPFAWLIGFHGEIPGATWIRLLVTAAAMLGGALVGRADQRWQRDALGPGLFLLSVMGVYFTVPDTEEAAALFGVALPLAFLGWPLRWARLGAAGAPAATGLLLWVAAIGGRGRPASIVGGLACLALLIGVSAAADWAPTGRFAPFTPTRSAAGIVALQLGLVFVGSRVAGLRHDVWEATSVSAAVVAVSVAAGRSIDRNAERRASEARLSPFPSVRPDPPGSGRRA